MKHIEYLLSAEKQFPGLMWDRSSKNEIWISYPGYKHMYFYEIVETCRKLGCKFNFEKGIEEFDKYSGRTECHLIEPKATE